MRYVVLATGFDGTLARDGHCDARSLSTLRALAASGRKLILVTSRQLREVLEAFPEAVLFDYLVAENGAVVHRPAARESEILAPAPSELLVRELRRREVAPVSVGSVTVTTNGEHRDALVDLIERLRLDCYVLDNGATVAVVPTGVNKATGVERVLEDLGLSAHNLVAVGDAENDMALFEIAEHGVAVANASSPLKHVADRVTRASYAEGFDELARELLESDLIGAPIRRSIVVGTYGQREVTLPPAACSILLCGPSGSGKAALCNGLLSQYLLQDYQCCVVGAYSAHAEQESFDRLVMCGDPHRVARHADVMAYLEQPQQSVVVNLAAVRSSARSAFAEELVEQLAALQSRTGRPHSIVLDRAEELLTAKSAAWCARSREACILYVTASPQMLPRSILESVDIVLALGDANGAVECVAPSGGPATWDTLEPGQALLWFRHSGTAPQRVDIDARAVPEIRAIPEPSNGGGAQVRSRASRIRNNEAAVP